ncbi:hypothetical protein [Xanthomonas campestris]|uniref:hypothetical protein n=1 Tax=Xanthomonas campestris TaxID=339 RepID=UPI0013794702|nr:hypothetical protein [Xanthomonas campestris]
MDDDYCKKRSAYGSTAVIAAKQERKPQRKGGSTRGMTRCLRHLSFNQAGMF